MGGEPSTISQADFFYIENADQQLYEILSNGKRQQITQEEYVRFADPILDEKRNSIYLIAEDHCDAKNVKNSIVKIHFDGNMKLESITSGHDFYSNPRLSPDGRKLLFLAWDHPNMPWDGTQLWLADLDEKGTLTKLEAIAGGPEESIFQPEWDEDGGLYYVSDKSGWWNIYRYSDQGIRCLLKLDAEFGLPQWVFGMSTYAILDSGRLVAAYRDQNGSHLILINSMTGAAEDIVSPYTEIEQVHGRGDLITFIGSSPEKPAEIVALNLKPNRWEILRRSSKIDLEPSFISHPELISYEVRHGEFSHAWYYPPTNPEFKAPEEEKPPLIVISHGGPTSYSSSSISMSIQYWTSRGFAIADVNYSGSTGYGRKYRERLNGNWGIRDVEDCCIAAKYLADQGNVDHARLIIKGGSAGGYTTLSALAFFDVFKAGASYYGVGDLTLLARDTHKFESRYLDRLVGKFPEEEVLYKERSALFHTEQFNCPVIFLQGLDDKVVPPNQAEDMLAALKKKGIPVAYVPFEGESHGFRQAGNIVKAIESEFYFYSKIFKFIPAEELKPIRIFNQ